MRRSNVVGDASSRAADTLQATYFRAILADQRTIIAADLVACRAAFAERVQSENLYALSRLRRELRMKETEQRTLDRMMLALEYRFGEEWNSAASAAELG